MSTPLEYENAVGERYAKAADAQELALCCPVVYRQDLLEVIPQEIIDRDYGCGDPSPFVKPGDTVPPRLGGSPQSGRVGAVGAGLEAKQQLPPFRISCSSKNPNGVSIAPPDLSRRNRNVNADLCGTMSPRVI